MRGSPSKTKNGPWPWLVPEKGPAPPRGRRSRWRPAGRWGVNAAGRAFARTGRTGGKERRAVPLHDAGDPWRQLGRFMTPASQIAPKSRYRDMFARRLGRACPTRRRSLALPAWLHDHRLAVVAALDAA